MVPTGASLALPAPPIRAAAQLRDLEGRPLAQRTLSVNQPLRYGGVTAYQTDWSMAALTVRAVGSPLQPADGTAFNLPMASLAGAPGKAGVAWQACTLCTGRGLVAPPAWGWVGEGFGGVGVWLWEGARLWAASRLCSAALGTAPGASRCLAGAESKLYATFIPAEQPSGEGRPRGVSVLAKDLQVGGAGARGCGVELLGGPLKQRSSCV